MTNLSDKIEEDNINQSVKSKFIQWSISLLKISNVFPESPKIILI